MSMEIIYEVVESYGVLMVENSFMNFFGFLSSNDLYFLFLFYNFGRFVQWLIFVLQPWHT